METKQLIEQLEHSIKYHLAPYNLGDEGKTIELIKEVIALLCQLEPPVIKKNGGQEEPPFNFMTAELINDDGLQYGNRVRKYWRITCEDWRDTEIEKKFILDARSFPEGTTIILRIPGEKLNQ